ncbi:MAG: hypothetical protein COA37_16525 [Hoeflea sp.]|nr:MAG: hypothetical protein COA37_16525 [Hoeflea sp.]
MNKSNAGFLVFLGVAVAIAFGAFFVAPNIFKTDTELASDETPKTNMVDATAPTENAGPESAGDGLAVKTTEAESQPEDPAASAPAADSFAMPSFDLLRVEPDGSTVIAGKAEPGSTLDIMSGETVIATTEVGSSGDFAVILDTPLPAGDYQLTLRVTDKDGKIRQSEEVATVSIPENADGELLAMVSKPGKASRIIAQPAAGPAEEKVEAAAASAASDNGTAEAPEGSVAAARSDNEGVSPASGEAEAGAELAADGASDSGTEVAADGVNDASAEGSTEMAAADTSAGDAGSDAQTPALPDASSVLTTSAPQISGESEAAAAPETDAVSDQQTEAADPDTGSTAEVAMVAPGSNAEEAPAPVPADASVRVDAVEIEGDQIFIAGSATAGYQVRVTADGKLIGTDTADESGRFIVEATSELSVGDHVISADLMDKAGDTVLLRATVPFNRPEGEALAAVAPAEDPGDASAAPAGEMAADASAAEELVLPDIASLSKMREGAFEALSALKQMASTEQSAETAEIAEALGQAVGRLKSAAIADLPADSSAEARAIAQSMRIQAEAALAALMPETAGGEADGGTAANSGTEARAIDRLVTGDLSRMSDILSQAEAALSEPADMTAANIDSTEMVVESSGEPGEPKTILQAPLASTPGAVIIRRGDTLWQISRRTYGEGVRYTTIYLANRSQIQNPDRIKPGQVFSVPENPLDGAEEMHKKLLEDAKKL